MKKKVAKVIVKHGGGLVTLIKKHHASTYLKVKQQLQFVVVEWKSILQLVILC